MNTIEKELIQNIKRGEHKAITLLFKSFYLPLCTYATVILNDKETAQDIVQDVFIKIWDSRDHLQIVTTLKGYLYRCVHNRCLNYMRVKTRTKQLSFSTFSLTKVLQLKIEIPPDVLETLFSEDTEKCILQAMKKLPDHSRKVFYYCRFENLSYSEISVKMDISLSTVKTQMRRAMIVLTNALKDQSL